MTTVPTAVARALRETADPKLLYLLHEGLSGRPHALERAVLLTASTAGRRRVLRDPWWAAYLLELFPEGLPDAWLTEAADACWARWYTERHDGR